MVPGTRPQFHNLQALESLITKLAAPKYPLADRCGNWRRRGESLFVSEQCMSCHWADAGTVEDDLGDAGQHENSPIRGCTTTPRATAKATGILEGVRIAARGLAGNPLPADASMTDLLGNAVGNTLLQELATTAPAECHPRGGAARPL